MGFTSSMFSSLIGILAVSEIISITIQLIFILFEIYIIIKIFDKARQPIWLAIIPIVNRATLLKIANMSPWWAILTIFSIICNFIKLPLIALIVSILELIIFGIVINVKLAKSFDYSLLFAIGMMIFPWVFYSILAFGDSKYIGTKEQRENLDNVFKLKGKKNSDYVPKSDFFRD